MMRDIKRIPENYEYFTTWGQATYSHMQAYVHIYKDKNDDNDNQDVMIEIGDKNEIFRKILMTNDEYMDLKREFPISETGTPLLYRFGFWQRDEDEDEYYETF
jgi:hypothetical protein